MSERILIVRNPSSTRADEVQQEVVDHFHDAYTINGQVAEFEITNPNKRQTIDDLSEAIRPGDRIIVAGGDGTGNATANAYLRGDSDGAAIGFLPYGNLNDMAATFSGRRARFDPTLLITDSSKTEVNPLEISINNEYFGYGVLYATLGWTATAAGLFDNVDTRHHLQQGRFGKLPSIYKMGLNYLKTRSCSDLPPFRRPGDEVTHTDTTDVLAINGPRMGWIIRSNQKYYETSKFLSKELDVSKLLPNVDFLGRSTINLLPGSNMDLPGHIVCRDDLIFEAPSIVPIQLDGEFVKVEGVERVSISKNTDAKRLVVLTL